MKEGLEKYFEDGATIDNLPEVEAVAQPQEGVPELVQDEEPPVQEVVETVGENAPAEQEATTGPLETIVDEIAQPVQEQPQRVLPENVDKLVDFLNDTPGATLQDYINLNRSFDEYDDKAVLREYYSKTKSHLDAEDVDFLLAKKFSFDAEDDSDNARTAKIALKEELSQAKGYLNAAKEKYYADLKSHDGIGQQNKEAIAQQEAAAQHFLNETNKVFEGLDGFAFDVGEKKIRYRMENPANVKEVQSNIENIIAPFIGENGLLQDVEGYHKAMFAARNADQLAKLFYEQGKADAIEARAKDSKNLDFSHQHRAPETSSKLKPGQVREIQSQDNRGPRINLKWNK